MSVAEFSPRQSAARDYEPRVLIGRCKACRRGLRVEAQPGHLRRDGKAVAAAYAIAGEVHRALLNCHADGCTVPCGCGAGRMVRLSPLRGRLVPEKACSPSCQNATGPSCECSCGGENHGLNHQ